MDGHFVPNITIGPPVVERIRKVTKLPLDVHLMILNADQFIPAFRDVGADYISVHAEASPHLQRTLSLIRKLGAKASVALNPATPLFHLDHVWEDLDMVLIMTVNPGFGGQSFISEMLNKVKTLAKKSERITPQLKIEVDGGVSPKNAAQLREAGANVFVAGSAIFGSPNYKQVIQELKSA
jgi:ribulose-phosphate 3-epimerase